MFLTSRRAEARKAKGTLSSEPIIMGQKSKAVRACLANLPNSFPKPFKATVEDVFDSEDDMDARP